MPRFWCWDEDYEEASEAQTEDAVSPDRAAAQFAGRVYCRRDYPQDQTISVRDESGELTRWRVTAEPTVEFWVGRA